jgi:hypothetical protein
MLVVPSPSLRYLLASGLEAVQGSCLILARIHRYYPACRNQGGGALSGLFRLFQESRGKRDQDCAGCRRLVCVLRDL